MTWERSRCEARVITCRRTTILAIPFALRSIAYRETPDRLHLLWCGDACHHGSARSPKRHDAPRWNEPTLPRVYISGRSRRAPSTKPGYLLRARRTAHGCPQYMMAFVRRAVRGPLPIDNAGEALGSTGASSMDRGCALSTLGKVASSS